MKIALTGPHCSGKSTVMRALQQKFVSRSDIGMMTYDGSRCPIDYSDVERLRQNPSDEIDLAFWMLSDLVKHELEASRAYKNVLLDRCVLDQLVYPAAILGENNVPQDILSFAQEWVRTHPYDHVFLFPRNEALLRKFGRKDKDEAFLMEIEQNYFSTLARMKIPHTMLPKPQVEQIALLSDYVGSIVKP